MDRLTVFVCYSSKDRYLAGRLKTSLEDYCGFEVFVAHDDIIASEEWELKIVSTIPHIDLFIPLISEDFQCSPYANQEVGIAMALKKKIVPIKLSNINPCGFMSKYQALKYSSQTDNIKDLSTGIVLLAMRYYGNLYREKALNSIIYALQKSMSFETSNIIIKIMCAYHKFTDTHVKEIIKAIKNNHQVKFAFGLNDLKNLLKKEYKTNIDSLLQNL